MNLAVIQARMGSTRLPSKVLMNLAGRTVLDHVVTRVGQSTSVDEIIVATTVSKADLEIVQLCATKKIRVFVGSEQDVLDRFYQAARLLNPVNVIRITSDCPMIDPEIIDLVSHRHAETQADYTSNTLEETFPDGLDVEIFKFNALEKAWKEAQLLSEREHVTPYIKKHQEIFKLVSVKHNDDLSFMRWTIDQSEDFIFLDEIFRRVYTQNPAFRMADVLREISNHPELLKINGGIIRNEGYLKSLKKD